MEQKIEHLHRLARHSIITRLMDWADQMAVNEYMVEDLYRYLSQNVNMDLDILCRRLNRPWCWTSLSRNKTITIFDVLVRFFNRRWDWELISRNPSIAVRDIIANKDRAPWSWPDVSANPTVTADLVAGNLDLPWDWSELSANKGITLADIVGNLGGRVPANVWDWHAVSQNPNVTVSDVVDVHPNKPWLLAPFGYAMSTRVTSVKQIEAHSIIRWDWKSLSANPIISVEYIQEHDDIPWDYEMMSRNVNITWPFIQNRLDKPWDWFYISQHSCISPQHIRHHPFVPWDYHGVAANPNLTFRQAWKCRNLTTMTNEFTGQRACLFAHHARRHVAALVIQLQWRRARDDPNCALGRVYQLQKFSQSSRV